MAKNSLLDYSTTPDNNTDLGGIGIQGTSAVNNFDNAFRTLMSQMRQDLDYKTVAQQKGGSYTAVANDNNSVIRFTAAATLSLTDAATLGANWHIEVIADGSDVIIDPSGSEQINGATTLTVLQGTSAFVICDGSAFTAVVSFKTSASGNRFLGGWEHITTIGVGGGSAVEITNLSAFYAIRITHRAIVTTGGYAGVQVSTDNGATFLTSTADYGFTYLDNFYNGSTSTVSLGDGSFAQMPIGDESSSGVLTISAFNATLAAYAVGQGLIQTTANRVMRNIGHQIKGTTPRNAMRIIAVGGTFIHAVFVVEGVRS
ncbi:hypothetical protein [Rhizobium nepotum]|uniref:hypothetical protein n=1 Tax=Rhizobium nepotum TaxID=1035271 RepID=UPI003EB69AB9